MFSKLLIVILTISILYFSLVNITYAQTWTQLFPTDSTSSTARYGHTAVYDTTNNRMTIFGGENPGFLNDVWVLSHVNGLGGTPAWTQLNPTPDPTYGLPTTRAYHSAVCDATNNRMTIFGGEYYGNGAVTNDVWVLSNANGLGGTPAWTQVGSGATPRYGHTAVYDTTNNRMIIFGGNAGSNYGLLKYLNDVWVLTNANGLGGTPTWTQLSPSGSAPTTRAFHSAVYDNINNRMTIFGGYHYDTVNGSSYLNDVWVLSNANGLGGTPAWTQLLPTGGPPDGRDEHTAIYDITNNRMTIFGGSVGDEYIYLNDIWVLSTANGLGGTPAWTHLTWSGNTPAERYSQVAVYDNTNNQMTIFGGANYYSGPLNDVWVLSHPNGLGAPEAGFYGTPTSGIGPLPVSFVDTSFFNPSSWNWNFGDGITTGFTLSSTTTHIYGIVTTPTSYTVQLVVSNSYGTSTSTQINYINVIEPGPTADFTGAPLSGYGLLTVYFFDGSNSLYGNSTKWNWSFGDGSTSNIQNPVHIYSKVSTTTPYTVQLIVITNFGIDTATKNNYVIILPSPAVEDWNLYSTKLESMDAKKE